VPPNAELQKRANFSTLIVVLRNIKNDKRFKTP
jgi:hypothetical protein